MDTFAERLRLAMQGPPKIKQVALAAACGIKPPSVSDWLNGRSVNIEGKNLLAASKLLNVRPEWLSKGTGPMRPDSRRQSNVEAAPQPQGKVPLISWELAGSWKEGSIPDPKDAEMWLPVAAKYSKTAYGLRVRGESMLPRFHEGEIIIIDPGSRAENGQFVIAKKSDSSEVVLKQLIREGESSFLKSLNPQWPEPIIRITEEWNICGRVVCKMELF